MKKIVVALVTLTLSSQLQAKEFTERLDKNPDSKLSDNLSASIDWGYTVYLIDVTSSELNRAIDYNVLEATLGLSYAWDWGSVGVNAKLLLGVDQSNLTLDSTDNPLNDTASIDRNEFFIYGNYNLTPNLQLNLVYKYSNLEANDLYENFKVYDTHFGYSTNGLVASLSYLAIESYHHIVWLNGGITYSQADIQIYEKIDGVADDVSIDDTQSAFGIKLGVGYTYKYSDDLDIRLTADWYSYDFGTVAVDSKVLGGTFDQATLTEQTYSVRVGVSYRFWDRGWELNLFHPLFELTIKF